MILSLPACYSTIFLLAGKTNAEYARYFNLPTIIHNQLNPDNKEEFAKISEQDRQNQPELARQQLKQGNQQFANVGIPHISESVPLKLTLD